MRQALWKRCCGRLRLMSSSSTRQINSIKDGNPKLSKDSEKSLNPPKPSVVIVIGTTGVGKSKLGIQLAQAFSGKCAPCFYRAYVVSSQLDSFRGSHQHRLYAGLQRFEYCFRQGNCGRNGRNSSPHAKLGGSLEIYRRSRISQEGCTCGTDAECVLIYFFLVNVTLSSLVDT